MIPLNNIAGTEKSTAYNFNSIKTKILSLLNLSENDEYTISGRPPYKIKITSKMEKVILYIKTNIDDILIGKPEKLRQHIEELETIDKDIRKTGKGKQSDINKLLKNIFVFKAYDSSNKDKRNIIFNKFEFIKELNIKCCPYCNRDYIYTTAQNKLKHEIDHFYPKNFYPYLAISYYNLIPSCKFCNQISVKGDFDTYKDKVTNPYEIKDDDFVFTYKLTSNITKKNISTIHCLDFKDAIQVKFKKKIDMNVECFHLEELYEQHSDIVIELICKKTHYPKSYIQDLAVLGFTKEEIYRFLLCNFSQNTDLHKRPLSKLTKDIAKELDLIPQ